MWGVACRAGVGVGGPPGDPGGGLGGGAGDGVLPERAHAVDGLVRGKGGGAQGVVPRSAAGGAAGQGAWRGAFGGVRAAPGRTSHWAWIAGSLGGAGSALCTI